MASKSIIWADKEYVISYEIIKPLQVLDTVYSKNILFLHGWGANKNIMKSAFSSNLSAHNQLYIDLPGFGNSSTPTTAINTQDYSDIVNKFCNNISFAPDIIIGHSFGGKIAALLNPDFIVLLSSAGIIQPKAISVRIKIFIAKLLKYFGLYRFGKYFISADAKGMNKNMYETFKKVVDEDFTDIYSKLTSKNALIFWGKEDLATPLKSGKRIHELIKNSIFTTLDGDHFFFTRHAKFISDEINKFSQ